MKAYMLFFKPDAPRDLANTPLALGEAYMPVYFKRDRAQYDATLTYDDEVCVKEVEIHVLEAESHIK